MTPQTITLTHLPNILLVLLPEEAKEYHIAQDYQGSYLCWDDGTTDFERQQFGDHGQFKFCDNPRNNWHIVSTLADVAEEWFWQVLPSKPDLITGAMEFTNQQNGVRCSDYECFISILATEGWYLENPIARQPPLIDNYRNEEGGNMELFKHNLREWREAQSHVLSRERTLILRRVGL